MAKARTGAPSDYRLAKNLGVTPQAVSNWRAGRAWPDLLRLYQMATMAQVQPQVVIADIERDRAEMAGRADQAGAWREWLEKSAAAACVMVSLLSFSGAPDGGALASTTDHDARDRLYIMST